MITRIIARCTRTFVSVPTRSSISPIHLRHKPRVLFQQHSRRTFAAKTNADEILEELQELYATAKDEFEIASEETDKKSVYAADDRSAAQEEWEKFKRAYDLAIKGDDGEEIKNRIGTRVRELERALEALEEKAMED